MGCGTGIICYLAKIHKKAEEHSVEHIYLRQLCFDASNHASLMRRAPNNHAHGIFLTWWNSTLQCKRHRRKQSGSGIRTMTRIGLKSWSVRPCPDTCRHAKCHPIPCKRFWVILLTDRQTRHCGQSHLPPPLSEVNKRKNRFWSINNIILSVIGKVWLLVFIAFVTWEYQRELSWGPHHYVLFIQTVAWLL